MTSPHTHLDTDTDTPADTDDEPRTGTTDTTSDDATATPAPTHRLPSFGLSGIQLVGTALAAITATVAASFLGVTGTVIGAALASVVTAIGNAVYTTSLRSTRDRVRDVVPLPARTTRSLPVVRDEPPTLPARPRPRPRGARPAGRTVWKRAAIGGISVFVVLMAVVTSIEALAGRPISDVVRGESGGGTSFFGHNTVTTKTVPPTVPPAPTVYVTVTPKVVVTTPTVTRTAPAATATATAPATATGTPTPTTSTTPTVTPSAAGSSTP